jgi:hypothetical protein
VTSKLVSVERAFESSNPTVITALPLKPDARQKLAELIGHANVLDITESLEASAVVDAAITPACSPQMIARLKATFPVHE